MGGYTLLASFPSPRSSPCRDVSTGIEENCVFINSFNQPVRVLVCKESCESPQQNLESPPVRTKRPRVIRVITIGQTARSRGPFLVTINRLSFRMKHRKSVLEKTRFWKIHLYTYQIHEIQAEVACLPV